jgi:hypothetical protein
MKEMNAKIAQLEEVEKANKVNQSVTAAQVEKLKQTHLKVKDDKEKIGKELKMEKDKESRLKDEISKLQEAHE